MIGPEADYPANGTANAAHPPIADTLTDTRRRRTDGIADRLHTTIARDLGIAIAAGRLLPGDTLTGEVASSARLSVSRTAYREAVRILAAKGLVESRTRTGTRVSRRSSELGGRGAAEAEGAAFCSSRWPPFAST